MFSLAGKTLLVTGSSSGIGRTIATTFSQQGASLIISGRNRTRLLETFNALKGGPHQQFIADLTKQEEIISLANQMPLVDGIVFCAGVIRYMAGKQTDMSMMDQLLITNFTSQIQLYRILHQGKKIAIGASLIFISSVSAHSAVPGTLIYAASKAALSSSVRVLASELVKQRIRVNTISPGLIRTPLLADQAIDNEIVLANEAKYPLGLGETTDVANAAVFLMSDESRWITGIDLIIDGGYMLHK